MTLSIVTALSALLYLLAPRTGTSSFRLSDAGAAIPLDVVALPTLPWTIGLLVIMAALTVYALLAAWAYRSPGLWLPIVYGLVAIFAFLVWSAADGLVPVTGLLFGAVSLSIPLIFGALGGIIGERVGVVNVAIEGQFLFGAFSAAMLSSVTGNPFVGLVAAMIAGVLVAFVLAAFSIKYLVDQVIVGVVLNVLVTGITGFLYGVLLVPNSELLNTPVRFSRVAIPLLSDIPIIGPVLFNQTFIVYLAYVAVAARSLGLSTALGGVCVCVPSASTRRPPTPWASRSTAAGSGTSRWPVRSPASAARTSRSSRSVSSARI